MSEYLLAGEATSQNISSRRYEGNAVAHSPGRALNQPLENPALKASAELILRALNTWAFKREQPSVPKLLLLVISEAVVRKAPLPFLFYWGKGPRCHIDEHDIKCLEFIEAMAHRVSAVHAPGTSLRLILTN